MQPWVLARLDRLAAGFARSARPGASKIELAENPELAALGSVSVKVLAERDVVAHAPTTSRASSTTCARSSAPSIRATAARRGYCRLRFLASSATLSPVMGATPADRAWGRT